MSNETGVDKVVANLSERANAIVAAGHSESEIMQSAMADFKGLNTIGGALSLMANGKPSAKQLEIAQRIAVKVIAVLGMRVQ